MTAPLNSLSIVLPCSNVAVAVAQAHRAGERYAEHVEVIVVDDGSSDDTGAIARELAGTVVVTHEVNRGYGAAVRSGIDTSHGAWVVLTDGDLQFDLFELGAFLGPMEEHDLVAGYRIKRADPFARRVAAHAWNRLMRRSFGIGVRDVDCAFKVVRGSALRSLPLESDGAMISTELLVRAANAGWRIGEVGVHHRPRLAGEPTGDDVRVIMRAFMERRDLLRRLQGEAALGSGAFRPV